jgi:hypothetical protein
MAAGGRAAGNVPAELTSFVGRRGEVAEVERLLSGCRLVTSTGVGGVGKTRLASEHLVDAVAKLTGMLLRAAAGMRVVATRSADQAVLPVCVSYPAGLARGGLVG